MKNKIKTLLFAQINIVYMHVKETLSQYFKNYYLVVGPLKPQ